MQRLMIVDDEPEILNPLQSMLEAEGYRIDAFGSPLKAISHLKRNEIALAICDIKMPEMSGYDLLKELRVIKSNLPVIFLSSKDEEQDQIIGFTLGADDYVTKPFNNKELLLRIKSLIKRSKPSLLEETATFKNLKINRITKKVFRDNIEIKLGPIEYKLIDFFIKSPQRVYSREQLLNNVWGDNINVESRTVDVHIRRLRKAINFENKIDLIRTVRSSGYSLDS